METKAFNYKEYNKGLQEDWQHDLVDIFRLFDEQCEGVIPTEDAVRAMELIGIDGRKALNGKKLCSIQLFVKTVGDVRTQNRMNSEKRWAYLFSLIAGGEDKTITVERLQDFFRRFGHVPAEKYCEDFIDEFDRLWLKKTEINLQDWLMFCRINRLPF